MKEQTPRSELGSTVVKYSAFSDFNGHPTIYPLGIYELITMLRSNVRKPSFQLSFRLVGVQENSDQDEQEIMT